MANNKSFKIKKGLSATQYLQSVGSKETTSTQVGPQGAFDTTLYTGTDGSQSVTTGLDLSNDGGLLWIKGRSSNTYHILNDSERTLGKCLFSNTSNAESGNAGDLVSSFNTNGFTVNTTHLNASNNSTNGLNNTYVAWTFIKDSNFFDVVTYNGNNNTNIVSHSLAESPGFVIIKSLTSAENWIVWHKDAIAPSASSANNSHGTLNGSGAFIWMGADWLTPGTSSITLSSSAGLYNSNVESYVAYLFGDNDNKIKCGSYTGNGSTTGPAVNLGWQPQWLLMKNIEGSGSWFIVDTERGIVTGSTDPYLETDTQNIEYTATDIVDLTDTGFQLTTNSSELNSNNTDYMYVAIRKISTEETQELDLSTGTFFTFTPAGETTVTFTNPPPSGKAYAFTVVIGAGTNSIIWPSSVKWEGGSAPKVYATDKNSFIFITTDGGTTYYAKQSGEQLS